MGISNKSIVGNKDLIQKDEEAIAAFLKERNLAYVNEISESVKVRDSFYTRHGKRILDFFVALVAVAVFFPLNLVFAICTFFDVGVPILYKQTRTGLKGKNFTIVKFRNMNNKKDDDGNLLPARERVTKFGYFMRRYSLDELLNFWNVLKGDMSLIGPRPLPTFFYDRMSERHKMRYMVRPGLECPRVISVEGELYQKQFENDVWYVENISFLTDIKMIFLLLKMTFSSKRSKTAAGGSYFVGYDDNGRAIYKELGLKLYGDEMKKVG